LSVLCEDYQLQADEATAAAADATLDDAKEIVQGRPYHWKDWCVVRGRDCLYLWSDVAALELSNGSNGWFRFILDGKLATMYSSGSPEGGSDSSGKPLTCNNSSDFEDSVLMPFKLHFSVL